MLNRFTKREKVLTGIIAFLVLSVFFLVFKIVDYKIDLFVLGGQRYEEPQSMEDSIEDASMIFLCKTEILKKTVRYRIEEIIYKDEKYEFPYELGDYFPRLQKEVDPGIYYGEGQIVILSSKPPILFRSVQVLQGTIAGFSGISLNNFKEKVAKIKNLNS